MEIKKPMVSVVIATYNRIEMLKVCIESLRVELSHVSHELVIVDGGSVDGTIEWLSYQKDIISVVQHNHGTFNGKQISRRPWAYFINIGFKISQGTYILMLSDDSLIRPGAVNNGLNFIEAKRALGHNIGGVAFYFRDYPIRKKFAVAVNVGNLYVNHGIFLNSAVKEVDYFDEDYHFYFSDTDIALKMKRQGYSILPSPNSFVEHYYDADPEVRQRNNGDLKEQDRLRLINKWCGIAYPSEKITEYLRVVGYWSEHETETDDETPEIRALMTAQNRVKSKN